MEKALEDNLEPSETEKPEPFPETNATPDTAQEQSQDHASSAVDEQQSADDEQQPVMDVQPTSSENQGNEPEKSETKASPGKRSNRSKGQKRTKPIGSAKCDSDASTPPHVPASDIWTFGMQTPAEEPKPKFVYPMTDLGNSQMFFRLFNKSFLYDQERGQWIGWDVDRKRWLTGKLAHKVLMRLIKKLVTELYRQAKSRHPLRTRNGETVTPEEALGWAKSTSQKGRQKAMLDLVRDLPGVRVSKAELDRDPYLLGVTNGVLDLRTGTLIENRPDLRITRYANAAYHKDADAPIFRRFMDEICLGRQDLVDFIQEVLGYSLSGLVTEHAFFLLVGTGANGKSTLVEAFLYLLGEYGIGMPSHAFLKSNSRAIRNDMARLPGVRFAPCAEVNTGMSLDESMVKRATGGDIMTARFIGKEYFDFHPSAKFFLSVNTLPKITGADNGIYRRLVVIPFEGNFEATMDGDLPKKLKDKIDGILAWAVQGFLRWQEREKLVKPQCVVDACAAYRAEMDTVQSFLDECCILEPKLIGFVQEEIARRRAGGDLKNASSLGPLNIYSHRQVNRFFEHVVAAHGLAEVFFQEWSLTKINGHFRSVLGTLARTCPALFTAHLCDSIMRNVAITYEFHRWFVNGHSRAGLDELIQANIRKIRFPDDLR